MPTPLDRLRKLCLALPESHEVEAWGEPTFRVRNKLFAMFASSNNHHGAGRPGVWIKSTHVNQDLMLRSDPDRFFAPPYVGPSGWIGVYLDDSPDWDALKEILRDGYLLTAPKRVAALLDSSANPPAKAAVKATVKATVKKRAATKTKTFATKKRR